MVWPKETSGEAKEKLGGYMKIFTSSGHNFKSPGASWGNYKEHELSKKITDVIMYNFSKDGISGVEVPQELSLRKRIEWVNLRKKPEDLAFEFHFNAFGGKAEGAEVFHSGECPRVTRILRHILDKSCEILGLKNRGLKLPEQSARGKLGWISGIGKGAALWEVCFMDNPRDLEKVDISGDFTLWGDTFVACLRSALEA